MRKRKEKEKPKNSNYRQTIKKEDEKIVVESRQKTENKTRWYISII